MVLNSVARTLQDARLAKGWNLKEASTHAGVAERFLRELEDGGSDIPVDIYRREFLRRYARALALSEEEVWKTFQSERQLSHGQHAFEFHEHHNPSWWQGPRQWRTFIGALTFSTIMLYVLFSFTRVWAAPDVVIQFPPDHLTVNTKTLTVRGSVSTDAVIMINGVIVVPTTTGTFEAPIILAKGLNTITIEAQRKRVHANPVTRQVYFETGK